MRRAFLAPALLVAACLLGLAPATALAAPGNDNFANAAVLGGLPASASGDNTDATKEPGEPDHAGDPGGQSVWWAWTAPAGGSVTVDTCGSGVDTLLAVYTGDSVGALSPVGSNDDACDLGSAVTFPAVAGQVYRIAVDSREGDTGPITLAVKPTLAVTATTLRRAHRVDATRFGVEVAPGGDSSSAPRLVLQRGTKRISVDLEIANEGDFFSETSFRYTFAWSCSRAGTWRWTVSTRRDGQTVSRQGSITVPRCVQRPWYVSLRRVRSDARRDGVPANRLRCRAVAHRRGSRASAWRCGLAVPGLSCRGSFLFVYSRVYQGRDLIASRRVPSGSVTCRG